MEFRLWKQGKVNTDNLSIKLREAISQANWDIVMEYNLLQAPLCQDNKNSLTTKILPLKINDRKVALDLTKEIEFNCVLETVDKINSISKNLLDYISVNKRKNLEPLLLPRKRHTRINPPTSKTTRSITFDDYDRTKAIIRNNSTIKRPSIKLNSFETGDNGILCDYYSKYLPIWMEFGAKIKTPSVKKHKIILNNPHLPNVIIKELMNLIQDTPKAFCAIPTYPTLRTNEDNDEIFVSYVATNPIQKCIVISRNFDSWKASTCFNDGTYDFPDMSPHALKHTQKFVPGLINNQKLFIPRQKILWILVECDGVRR